MNDRPSILVIGNSHVECLVAALKSQSDGAVKCLNLRQTNNSDDMSAAEISDWVKAETPLPDPDVVCLCVKGNQHNIYGIVESPKPFSLGAETSGAPGLNDPARSFIPFHLMVDHLVETFKPEQVKAIYDTFPRAARLYLNPPPPIGDWDHIVAHPRLFADRLGQGPAPKALRLQLYAAQTAALRRIAQSCKARFVAPPPDSTDGEGFMVADFWGIDPTHGNAAYGARVLENLSKVAQEICAEGAV